MTRPKGRPRKLTREEVDGIRALYYNTKESLSSLARMYRISTSTVNKVISRKPPYDSSGSS